MSKGNPKGRGTKTLGVNMKEEMAAEIESRAKGMHIPTSAYIKIILRKWIDSGEKIVIKEN